MYGWIRNFFVKMGWIKQSADELNARGWLDYLRQRSDSGSLGESAVKYVREYTAKASLTLADIGTSEKELGKLLRQAHGNCARRWLDHLRRGSDVTLGPSAVRYVNEYAVKANITLADIGTSEEELAKLLRLAYGNSARTWLDHLRQKPDSILSAGTARYIKKYVAKAELTLADIGTSEEELDSRTAMATAAK